MNWLSRGLRWAPWLAAAVMVMAIIVWLGGPSLVSSIGAKRLSEALGRQVTMQSVRIEPWDIAVSIEQLAVARAAGDSTPGPQLRIGHLRLDLDIRALVRGAPVIESVDIDDVEAAFARIAPGHYDIDDIVGRLAAPRPRPKVEDEGFRFALFNLRLAGGRVDFDDRPVGRRHELRDLQLGLPFLSNLPADVAIKVQPKLAFTIDGTRIESGGESTPFAADRASTLEIRFGDVDLARWAAYWPQSAPAKPTAGILSAETVLHFSQGTDGVTHLGLSGTMRSRDAAFVDAAGAPLASWRSLELALGDVRPLERLAALQRLRVEAPAFDVARLADGRLNLAALSGEAAPRRSPVAPGSTASAASSAVAAASAAIVPPPAAAGWRLSLAEASVTDGRVRWSDAATNPAAAMSLEQIALELRSASWPLAGTAPWNVKARLSAAGRDAGTLAVEGRASAQAIEADAVVGGLALSAFDPYLASMLKLRLDGEVEAHVEGRIVEPLGAALPEASIVTLQATNLRLVDRAAGASASNGPDGGGWGSSALPSVRRLGVADARFDFGKRRISIARISATDVSAAFERDAKGQLNVGRWWLQPSSSSSSPAWKVAIAEAGIDGGRLTWRDAAPPLDPARPVALGLDGVSIAAKSVAWPATSAGDFEASARLRPAADLERGDASRRAAAAAAPVAMRRSAAASTGTATKPVPADTAAPTKAAAANVEARRNDRGPGRIEWNGTIVGEPFAARGRVTADRLPVALLEPYLHASLPVDLVRADAGFRGQLEIRSAPGGTAGSVDGDATIGEMHLQARRRPNGSAGDDLVRWQSLRLPGLKAQWQPGSATSVQSGEGMLSDFYANLAVTEQGHLNLNEFSGAAPAGGLAIESPIDRTATAAAPPPASAPSEAPAAPAVRYSLAGLQLVNGRVDFADHFVKPNYSAALTDLSGRIGAFRSDSSDMAPIELQGRVAGTARIDLKGTINPIARPLALDVEAHASDLELAPLSPYAAKYAGYAIERGRLTMNVHYTIQPDGRLVASNRVVLNQLTLGERVESPTATTLPVRLALALLKDRNGNIDLDLPVSGSLSDPQFSFAGLIGRVLGNLIVRAVSAPFSFLTGGSESASTLSFEPGRTTITTEGAAELSRIAKALAERPALQLTIAGSADPAIEREAMQQAALDRRVDDTIAAGDRADGRAAAPRAATAAASLTGEDRERAIRRIYRQSELPDKPRNLLGFAKDLPPTEMEALLRRVQPVSDDGARELASQRGVAVRDALIAQGVPSDRLFLAAPRVHGTGDAQDRWQPSAELVLAPR